MSTRKRRKKRKRDDEDSSSEGETSPPRKRRKVGSSNLTWKQSVVKVLEDNGKCMTPKDISEEVIRKKYRKKTKTPHLTVSNIINTNIRESDDVMFYNDGPGLYGLSSWGKGKKNRGGKRKRKKKPKKKKPKKKKKSAPKKKKKKEEEDEEEEDFVDFERVHPTTNILKRSRSRKRVDYRKLSGIEDDYSEERVLDT